MSIYNAYLTISERDSEIKTNKANKKVNTVTQNTKIASIRSTTVLKHHTHFHIIIDRQM